MKKCDELIRGRVGQIQIIPKKDRRKKKRNDWLVWNTFIILS